MKPLRVASMLLGATIAACAAAGGLARTPAGEVVGHLARADLTEASAAAASRAQPGVYWTLNDSGGAPIVYAFDLAGRDLGAWRLHGATNLDWESLAVGPCNAAGAGDCLYVGDTGDNDENRPFRTLYRLPEPKVTGRAPPGALAEAAAVQRMDYTYEDGPHDVEAMYVARDAGVWLVTKGRSKGVRAFHIPADAWVRHGAPATARAVSDLPIPIDPPHRVLVTDAAISPDGVALAVRTYGDVYLFQVDPETGAPRPDAPVVCDVRFLAEPQGEGIGWHPSGKALVLSSEGVGGQISLLSCPAPKEKPYPMTGY